MSSQEAVTVQKRKRVGRPRILDTSLEVRLSWSDMYLLSSIGFFERRDLPELMRNTINDMRKKYRKDVQFREWVERHKGLLEKEGIPVAEIW